MIPFLALSGDSDSQYFDWNIVERVFVPDLSRVGGEKWISGLLQAWDLDYTFQTRLKRTHSHWEGYCTVKWFIFHVIFQ